MFVSLNTECVVKAKGPYPQRKPSVNVEGCIPRVYSTVRWQTCSLISYLWGPSFILEPAVQSRRDLHVIGLIIRRQVAMSHKEVDEHCRCNQWRGFVKHMC